MRIRRLITLLLAVAIIGCQSRTATITQPAPANTPASIKPSSTPGATREGPTSAPTLEPVQPNGEPISFTSRSGQPLADVSLKQYQPEAYSVKIDALPVDLAKLGNPGVIQGLTEAQIQFLRQNGFVTAPMGDTQFKKIRRTVSNEYGQPYYLTTDAAYHALHITFNDLLKALEREYLYPITTRLVQAVYQKVSEYAVTSQGQPVEADTRLAQAYLAVALKLFKPESTLDPQIEKLIAPQLAQIMGYGGKDKSALIPGFMDDYGAYRPVSHYAGVPELEDYFRGMSWLGRVPFKFYDPDQPDLKPSRAPLLVTLALREAVVDSVPAYQVWTNLDEITDFMVGPSDNAGPVELNALMEQVYGKTPALADLSDEAKWQAFLARTGNLPAPRINSTFASFSTTLSGGREWRFMGQRFTPDGFIFQNLIFDKVGTTSQPRKLPTGLDIAAAFGSTVAWQELESKGETKYAHYSEQMKVVQKVVNDQPEEQWLNRFYTSWLYAFRPQVALKADSFPPYMRTPAWGFKDANSMLGSWAELKHDTVLYAKMPEMLGGGGPPTSGPAPACVEPNPEVFYRLAYAAETLYKGLEPKVFDWEMRGWMEAPADNDEGAFGVSAQMRHLKNNLVDLLPKFGDIAVKELQGQPLTADDYSAIQSCLELKECMDNGGYSRNPPEPDPISVIAAVSGAEDQVLEAGVGNLNRIFVAVPLEGKLQIAQGGVFSYYEFTQLRSDRLTDEAWREKLAKEAPASPSWMSQFVLPGGSPNNALAFRIGDVYIVTKEGGNPPLNLRSAASKSASVLSQLEAETYLTIIDGPDTNAEGTWWKVQLAGWGADQPVEGWVLENPAWFERSY